MFILAKKKPTESLLAFREVVFLDTENDVNTCAYEHSFNKHADTHNVFFILTFALCLNASSLHNTMTTSGAWLFDQFSERLFSLFFTEQ